MMKKRDSHELVGWELTFYDDFDEPYLSDLYWFTAYRSGKVEYERRIGGKSRWLDNNAEYVIENSILKLRITEDRPKRNGRSGECVSGICTSDHRFGDDENSFQILEKFSRKYGRFEIRCRCPRGEGIMSAFWLHQCDPTKQEFSPGGVMKNKSHGALEIDIFEQQGRYISDDLTKIDLNIHFTADGHYLCDIPVDFSKDFHVWAMEWREGCISWYLDEKLVKTYNGPTPPEKMFLLAALFQYSGWIGEVDPNLTYPIDFEIDYIKVYREKLQ